MACFDPIKATSQRNDDPAHASRPFDRDRDGFVMGEGCAIRVLEELEAASARGAHIYCEVVGYGTRGNAYHMTGLNADALEMSEAILDAIRQAQINPEDIDYVNVCTAPGPSRTTGTRPTPSRTHSVSRHTRSRSARSNR